VEDGIHEVAGTVAGKGAASAVGAVGSRGQAEDENAGAGIAEAGHGAGPVDVILVGAAAGFADAATIFAQAGAEFAAEDRLTDAVQIRRGRWKLSQNPGQWNLGWDATGWEDPDCADTRNGAV
jgi:hypothetical protein